MRSPLLPVALPPECSTCHRGCTCTGADASCGHYGCYGRGPLTCPAAHAARTAYEERLAAVRRQRAVLHARRSAWRSAADAALIANLLP